MNDTSLGAMSLNDIMRGAYERSLIHQSIVLETDSAVIQWAGLTKQAANFGLSLSLNSGPACDAFGVGSVRNPMTGETTQYTAVGTYACLAEVRAAIHDWVAQQRAAGAKF